MKAQQGVALVVAMLIVAITSVIATEMFYQQQISVRRTLSQIQSEQLYQVFISSEQWAKLILQEDIEKGLVDHLDETWAQNLPPFEAEGAIVKGSIQDLHGCFNLNNLVINGKADKEQIKILQQLLKQLQLNPDLVWSIVDWIDADDEPYPNGAEWETYSRLQPAYRAANYYLFSINELYAVSGWNKQNIETLREFVCTLPFEPSFNERGRFFKTTQASKININTASLQLLNSLSDKMQQANLDNILEQQKNKGFKSVDEFLTQLDTDNPSRPKLSTSIDKRLLSVESKYFRLNFSAKLDNLEQHYQSILFRKSPTELYTIYRQQNY